MTEPGTEALAKAQAQLIAEVQAQPSQQIVALAQRIREVIRCKRPPDEDALMAAEPEKAAAEAGSELNATVHGETTKVQANYDAMGAAPAPAAPVAGQPLPRQPDTAATAPIGATAAVPDAVPARDVSLGQDAAQSRQQAQDAGMATAPAALVQTGPVAEARAAQGEFDQAAVEDPAKVLARQRESLGRAENDMAGLQAQALAALEASRGNTKQGNQARQGTMVGSEESMRTRAAGEAKSVFEQARASVQLQLKDLPSMAMTEWEANKEILAAAFKTSLADVQQRVDKRHAGFGGFFNRIGDWATGLPGWATEGYTKAESAFAEGVIAKLLELSTKVNSVIAACDLIIKTARDRIAKIFKELPGSLSAWAREEQAKFDGQLDGLHNQVIATRDDFTKQLVRSASSAVDEVRAEISELRQKAAGLVGRIANAVQRFLQDPVKFIIDGLLELLGIPPASFWAVVAKIKKVIKDIADDPVRIAGNLLKGLAEGFGKFFDHFGTHLLQGFMKWLLGGVKDVRVPKDLSLRSVIGFLLDLMGITWPNIRKILVKLIGAKNVALLEKVWSIVSTLITKGAAGIYEMIKEKLDPQVIIDQIVQTAVEFMTTAIMKQIATRILLLFNPAGAILQAIEAIYRVLKWIFQNAAQIFTLIETVVNGIGDLVAGNTAGFAAAVEKALAGMIAPVIKFIADYTRFANLPDVVAEKVKGMREWVLGMIEKALTWLIEKGKALLGIGKKGKPDPGKVGEDLSWKVNDESHHLWITETGGRHVPMVASEKHPVDKAIEIYRAQATKLAEEDPEAAAEATKSISAASSSQAALTAALADLDTKLRAAPEKTELAAERAAITTHQEALRTAIADVQTHLGLGDSERVKLAKAKFSSSPFSTKGGLASLLNISPKAATALIGRWKRKGIIFRVESSTTDKMGLNTFDPATAGWRETNPDNRRKYGYDNPPKTSAVGLRILSEGLMSRVVDGKVYPPTESEKTSVDYHVKKALYHTTSQKGNAVGFGFSDAILGHHDGYGASDHWNDVGHRQTRSQNYDWNQQFDSYQGPEEKHESAATGAGSSRYELPTQERESNECWWKKI